MIGCFTKIPTSWLNSYHTVLAIIAVEFLLSSRSPCKVCSEDGKLLFKPLSPKLQLNPTCRQAFIHQHAQNNWFQNFSYRKMYENMNRVRRTKENENHQDSFTCLKVVRVARVQISSISYNPAYPGKPFAGVVFANSTAFLTVFSNFLFTSSTVKYLRKKSAQKNSANGVEVWM